MATGAHTAPSMTLNNAQTPSADGHTIFVHTGVATTTPDGIVLKPSQTLWGQGTTFTLNGLTIRGQRGKPTVTGTITLASQRDRELARHQYWREHGNHQSPPAPSRA